MSFASGFRQIGRIAAIHQAQTNPNRKKILSTIPSSGGSSGIPLSVAKQLAPNFSAFLGFEGGTDDSETFLQRSNITGAITLTPEQQGSVSGPEGQRFISDAATRALGPQKSARVLATQGQKRTQARSERGTIFSRSRKRPTKRSPQNILGNQSILGSRSILG